MSPSPVPTVVWFKRDLRIRDHRPLSEAATKGPTLPLYIVEPSVIQAPDFDACHWGFVRQSLVELQEELRQLGQPLVIRIGETVPVLQTLLQQIGPFRLLSHEETGNQLTYRRDLAVAAWAKVQGIEWREYPQNGVIRRLSSRNGWADRWHRRMTEPALAAPVSLTPPPAAPASEPIPTFRDLGLTPSPQLTLQPGGESAAHRCLDSFLEQRGARYHKEMSSPLTSETACSRLSPYLALGCISMRTVVQKAWARAAHLKEDPDQAFSRMALRSFLSRCHWHCHFMQKLEDEPTIETRAFNPLLDDLRPATPDAERLERWQKGQTGFPFVDACIRYLNHHRWINFRMRAMLVSFAAYDLWLDWRHFRDHLARQFLDYEPGIHFSQIQMQSGTTGINTLRIYNPIKQGHDQDPDGEFIRRWVPELASIPGPSVHEPWSLSSSEQNQLGPHYPAPIVDHAQAVRHAREAFKAFRQRPEFQEAAQQVKVKHGSRKRSPRKRAKPKDDPQQLRLL